jgi:hypothetical protein
LRRFLTPFNHVIPDAAKRRSGIQTQALKLLLDSGFALTRAPE